MSDVVMGQRGQTVDTLESEGQLEKSFLLLNQQIQKRFPTFLTLCLTAEGRALFLIISKNERIGHRLRVERHVFYKHFYLCCHYLYFWLGTAIHFGTWG